MNKVYEKAEWQKIIKKRNEKTKRKNINLIWNENALYIRS